MKLILINNYHRTTYTRRTDGDTITLTAADIRRARDILCPEHYLDNPYTPCPCRNPANQIGPLNERGPQTAFPVEHTQHPETITYKIIS